MNNKELEEKIITYLEKLEKNDLIKKISNKKRTLLLANKQKYEKIDKEKKDYQELFQESSKEEHLFLLNEIKNLEEQREQIIDKIKEQIIEEENINQNIIMEIRPGPGGDEAGLFVNDLYCMYANFAAKKG